VPHSLTRRDVLRGTWQALVGAAVVPLAAVPGHSLDRRTVIVRLRGGADGLSLVPPYGDPVYRRARPTLALPPPGAGVRAAIDVDGFFGLHPALAPIVPLFRAGCVDVWPACRVPGARTSHLHADLALDDLMAELRAEPVGCSGVAPAGTHASPFGLALDSLRSRLEQTAGPRVFVVDSCGWDHHGGDGRPGATLDACVDDFARSVAAFVRALGAGISRTTIVTVSEFGRMVAENTRNGTEHGDGTAMLVIGGGVRRRGIRGPWPRLQPSGGVRATTSVRDILRTVCH
jgi:uncharacterized protein (DUF1501 family)